jgi:hypothetical protein
MQQQINAIFAMRKNMFPVGQLQIRDRDHLTGVKAAAKIAGQRV